MARRCGTPLWHTAVFYNMKPKIIFLLCLYQIIGKESSFHLGAFKIIVKSDYKIGHVRPSRVDQLGSHWTDFHEI